MAGRYHQGLCYASLCHLVSSEEMQCHFGAPTSVTVGYDLHPLQAETFHSDLIMLIQLQTYKG